MDWKRIVEFHKEIVLRAQDEFYRLKKADQRRYSEINNFNPDNLFGPWIILQHQISNDYFNRNVNHLKSQSGWVLGLIGFKYFEDLCPIFVKEVVLEIDENLNWNIQPNQANWDLSPQFVKIIGSNSNIDLNDLNDNINKLMERVFNRFNAGSSDALLDLLYSELLFEYPDIKDSIGNDIVEALIFNTPDQAGKYDKNLMKDYDLMLEKLNKDPSDIGGLTLIESYKTNYVYDDNKVKIDSIIPLNQSQENAVKGILLKNPITVISGPPGCGKSQVVVSALYNLWLNNSSVLFASQNNKAVEVVKERFDSIEMSIPILARAGSKQFSNIEKLPRIMTNALANVKVSNKDLSLKEIEKKVADLKISRGKLQDFINSKVPIKLEETYRAALSSYYESLRIIEALKRRTDKFNDTINDFGIACHINDLYDSWIKPINDWISKGHLLKNKAIKNAELQKSLEAEINELNNELTTNAADFGLTNIEELNGLQIEQYNIVYSIYNDFCNSWKDIYSKHIIIKQQSNNYVNSFSKQVLTRKLDDVRNVLNNLNKIITDYGYEYDNYLEHKKKYEDFLSILGSFKLDKDIEIDITLIKSWIEIYINSSNELDLFALPFSKRFKNKKKIELLETNIKSKLPNRAVLEIGQFNQNRNKLLNVLISIQDFYEFKFTNPSFMAHMPDIEKDLNDLSIKIKLLEMNENRFEQNSLNGLINVKRTFEQLSDEYGLAIEIYEQKEQQTKALSFLKAFEENLQQLYNEDQLIYKITNKHLNQLITLIRLLINETNESNCKKLTIALENDNIRFMFKEWKKLVEFLERKNLKTEQKESILTYEELLQSWQSDRLDMFKNINRVIDFDVNNLPETQLVEKLQEIYEEYSAFSTYEIPVQTKKANFEYNFAIQKLNEVIDNYSSEILSDELIEIIDKLGEQAAGTQWPMQKIEELIKNKDVSKLQIQIEKFDREIQNLVKVKGTLIWQKYIKEFDSILQKLDRLISSFGKSTLEDSEFSNILKILPVWITTAQSSRGIPLKANLFDTLIIDEASQCTLTNLLPLIYRAKSIVVIGDLDQLPAIPNIGESTEIALAEKFKLSEDELYNYGHVKNDVFRTMLNFLPGGYSNLFNLVEHYRSIPQIIVFSNRYIYNQKLLLRRNVSDDVFKNDSLNFGVHKRHISGEVTKGKNYRSWMNQKEADQVLRIVDELIAKCNVNNKKIGIVTPFTAQVDLIENMLSRKEEYSDIVVGTAHKFQGDERDVIILSTVLSTNMKKSTIDWIQKPHNLINVAITRARDSLIVVGDFITMKQQTGILKDLSDYIDDIVITKGTSIAEYKLLTYLGMQGIKPKVHQKIRDIEVDFIITSNGNKLAIEIDGGQHENQKFVDQSRDALLLSLGYKTLRILARDVLETPNVVVDNIVLALE